MYTALSYVNVKCYINMYYYSDTKIVFEYELFSGQKKVLKND